MGANLTLGQRLLAHGSVYTAARIINNAIGFLLLPFYARALGDAGFGLITLIINVAVILEYVIDQGTSEAWFRLRFDLQSEEERRRFEATIVWYSLVSVVIVGSLLWAGGTWLAATTTPGVAFYPYWVLAGCVAYGNFAIGLYEKRLQLTSQQLGFALFSVLRSLASVAAIVLFVVGLDRGALGKVEADALVLGVFAALGLLLLRPAPPTQVSMLHLRRSLAYGLPLMPHATALYLQQIVDRLIVNAYLGLAATGVYTMGARLASITQFVVGSFLLAYRPLFFDELTHEAERPQARVKLARLSLLFFACAGLLSLWIAAVSREALLLIATEQFAESWTVVALASGAITANAAYAVMAVQIYFSPRAVRVLPLVTICGGLLSVVLNLWLIPQVGIMGAAAATAASGLVIAGLAVRLAQFYTPLPHRWCAWIAIVALLTVGLTGTWLLDAGLADLGRRMAAKLGVAAAVSLAVLWWTDFSPAELIDLARRLRRPPAPASAAAGKSSPHSAAPA